MAPKKKVIDDGETLWRTTIEEAPLDDENWKVKVVLIESAGNEQERMYLNKFETFAAEERRFVIKNICKTETIFMINQLGSDQKVKDPNLRVFEECQAYLSDKKEIPSDFLALVIKHLILKMKDEYLYISRQRLEVKQGMQRESLTMLSKAEVKGTVCVAPDEPQQKGDGQHAISSLNEEGKKFSTQLRVRGEEWRDKVYVDDYPTDGPNLYIAVTGFVEPNLVGSLVKIGIPLKAVVQIRIDPTSTIIPSSLFRPTKRGQSLTELLAEKSFKFWEDIQQLRIQESTADMFKDTAFIVFSPPYWKSNDLTGNSSIIYDELCYLMYDVQDLTRQHLHYLHNMSIMEICKDVINEFVISHYQQLINDLPLESVTIYSVLDSILHTACISLDLDDSTSRTSLSSANTLNGPQHTAEENSANLVKQIFNTLCAQNVTRKYRLTYGQEYEENKDPIVLKYGDFAKYNNFHLGDINLDNIVSSSLYGMPIHNLWRNQPPPSDELEAKVNFHVNVLLSCFDRTDVETSELNRLIHILACRKLYNNRSSLKKRHLPEMTITEFKKKYLNRSILAEPLARGPPILVSSCHNMMSSSFPSMTKSENEYDCPLFCQSIPDPEVQRIKLLFDCPDISELVSAAEIENNQPIKQNMIDDFDFFEDLTGNCAFQIMRDAYNNFNCVDYKYCEVTDCFILMFYNSHDKEGIAREEWRSHLTTPVCLQDFFDFVLEEQYTWIQDEEKAYDENLIISAKSVSKDLIDPHALESCIEKSDVVMELLMEGSLKHEEFTQVDVVSHTDLTVSVPTKSPISFDLESKVNKKGRVGSSQKSPKLKLSFIATPEFESVELPAKPFLGYDLGDRRVEVFGKDAMFFSRDGTKVTSLYTLTIPTNLEYIVLNILPGNSYNEFWMHKVLGDYVKPEVKDTCESFRITSKDRVQIYVKKQMYKVFLEDEFTKDVPTNEKKENKKEPLEEPPLKIEVTKFFHSLLVTWPNGMITETVYEDNSPVISHIKQYHTGQKPDLNEEMRCISLNGEVIIFKRSDEIEVLKPDGTYIKIEKYNKRVVLNNLVEPPNLEMEKSKKSKVKVPKKQHSKISELETVQVLPIEYELVIEEFEIIEPSGLREKWIDDVPFTIEKLLIKTATDYCIGEVFSRRMDGTNILMNKHGLHCVTFPNKTRIVTSYEVDDVEVYPEWTEEELEYFERLELETIEFALSKGSRLSQRSCMSTTATSKKIEEEEEKERSDGYVFIHILYTIEHPNFSTISINNVNGSISVESPNETTVTVYKNNSYDFILDNVTTANFDGENLNISYEACSECRAFTNCNVTIISNGDNSSNNNIEQVWLKMTDSFNTQVVVTEEGAINISDDTLSEDMEISNKNPSEEKDPDLKSESSLVSHGKCREMYLAKNIRFFVLRRDLNCAELLHRAIVEEYKRACQWKPWCSINKYDTFGDHRNLVSILTPIHLTESEKWLMDSKQANKPKFMTYKDLKPDSGKGFYHWMRPYERFVPQPLKPDNVLPERLPRAYILRTLEREWDDEKRKELKGARELLTALLRYRYVMQTDCETLLNAPIIDPRPDDERRIDDIIQALAHRIYKDLKIRISDDIQSRAKVSITTRPPMPPKEMSFEGESYEEEETDEAKQKALEEERAKLVKEAEDAEGMSPALRRYWRRRAEEYKEEQFYRYLLREGSVPPYYRNVLGGAIWWEVNNATDEAVTRSERRKMKCVCIDNEGTYSEPTTNPFM